MRGPDKATTDRARRLRQADNEAEIVLWNALRGRRLNGYKFVRQLPIGPYFADFACRDLHLVVEIDGSQHVASERDQVRDAYMVENGWSVVRFWNVDALSDCPSVLDTLLAIAEGQLREPVTCADFRFIPAETRRPE